MRTRGSQANNKRMAEHLESLTAELRKWRRISGRPPTEYHASKPGGAGGWLGYTPAESTSSRLLSPDSAITRMPPSQPSRALPTAPALTVPGTSPALLTVPTLPSSSPSPSASSLGIGGGMSACPPERPPRPTRAEPVPVRVVETEVPRPQHRSAAARPRSPGTRRANVPTVLAPHSPLQQHHHPQQQQQQQQQPSSTAPAPAAAQQHPPQQQVPTGAPRPLMRGAGASGSGPVGVGAAGGSVSPNHDGSVPPARRMSVGRGAPPGAGGPGRGRGGPPGRGAPGTPGTRRPAPPASGRGGMRPHSDDGRASVVMTESASVGAVTSSASANANPETRLAELRDRMRACTLKRQAPSPTGRTASITMSPARVRPNA